LTGEQAIATARLSSPAAANRRRYGIVGCGRSAFARVSDGRDGVLVDHDFTPRDFDDDREAIEPPDLALEVLAR
jgi:hypothetical protein